MTASIERNVYVLRRELPNPIHYVRSTNAISLIFHFRDIEIPSGATAQVYVRKPSSKEVYNTAVISGSDVTVDITTQMFIEAGKNILQVQINQGEENLVTFEQPVIVHENYTEGDAEQSENESTLLQQYVDEVAKAAEDAKNEVQNEVANGKNDLDDYVEALKETIPADYTELSESVEQLERNKAPAIIEEASGTEITVDDSGPAPVKDLQLYGYSKQVTTTGAQLYDAGKNRIGNGISITISDDGGMVFNGTATNDTFFNTSVEFPFSGNIYASMNNTAVNGNVIFRFLNEGGAIINSFSLDAVSKTASYNFTESVHTMTIRIANGTTLNDFRLRPMINSGTSALPWEPYSGGVASPSPDWAQPIHSVGDGGSVTVNSVGANLFRTDNISTTSAYGATVRNNGDGSFTISGTGMLTDNFNMLKKMSHDETISVVHDGIYTMSGAEAGGPYALAKIVSDSESIEINTMHGTGSETFPRELIDDVSATLYWGLYGIYNEEIDQQTIYPMLNRGSTPLPWQPYTAPSSALIALTDSLRGIPVSSGGNYTDDSGQQWIADYIYRRQTDGKWMLWRNCGSIVYDGSEDEGWAKDPNFERFYSQNTGLQESTTSDPKSLNSLLALTVSGGTQTYQNVYTITNSTSLYVSLNGTETLDDLKRLLAQKPMTLVGILATPTVEELPEPVQTDLNGLYTYNLHTDMWNSDNAHMALKYVADTKSYIDKKIAEISDAIIKRLN